MRASLSRWHVHLQCKLRSGVYTPNLASIIINPDADKQTSIKDVGLALFSQDYTQRLWLFLLPYVTKLVFLFSAQNMVKFKAIVYLHANENSNSAKTLKLYRKICVYGRYPVQNSARQSVL